MLNEWLLYNSIILYYANKKGWDMKTDLNTVLSKDWLTVDWLLHTSCRDFLKTNANEVMWETHVWFGKEFVQEKILISELIDRFSLDDSLISETNIREMIAKEIEIPVKGKKLRMVLTTELLDAPKWWATNQAQVKKVTTPTITLTAKEMKITIYYTDLLLEDSVINMAEYVLWAIADAYETSIHEVLINWDTETWDNANINIIDGTIAELPDWAWTDFLMADWIRKTAIANGATVDAGWNLAIEVIRSARSAMWIKWGKPQELRIVPDYQTYMDLLNLTEVETIEKFWDAATVVNWVLEAIDWIKIVKREEMQRALANWTISKTPASNNKWQLAIVHIPSIHVWLRRWLMTELSRYAEDGATWITWRARVAVTLENVQNNLTPTCCASLITNI